MKFIKYIYFTFFNSLHLFIRAESLLFKRLKNLFPPQDIIISRHIREFQLHCSVWACGYKYLRLSNSNKVLNELAVARQDNSEKDSIIRFVENNRKMKRVMFCVIDLTSDKKNNKSKLILLLI